MKCSRCGKKVRVTGANRKGSNHKRCPGEVKPWDDTKREIVNPEPIRKYWLV